MLTLADLRTEARDTMLDTDSLGYAIDATTLDRFLNKAYVIIKGVQDDRPVDFSATDAGTTFALGARSVTVTATNIRRILAVYRTNAVGSTTPLNEAPLEYVDDWEMQLMQAQDSTQGTPSVWAAWRIGTATAADVGKLTLGLWRITDSQRYYMLRALVEPTLLVNDTDKPDVDDDTAYAIAWMAAAVGARIIGRDEAFISDIKKRVPATMQAAYARMQRELFGARDVEKR